MNDFYNDDQTAWVFTADHGMSDFGSHGDGHPDNTRTPLVAWGAGIPKPNKQDPGDHDEFSEQWDLNSVKRNDVNQADIAPLMSYLVGINYPANSVGELPLAFVQAPDRVKAEALSKNAYAIAEQYLVKEAERIETQLKFVPYPLLSGNSSSVGIRKAFIEELIAKGEYEWAIKSSEELMNLGLQGLRYLQTYNWLFLKTLVTLGFLGWIGYAITSFLYLFVVNQSESEDLNSNKTAIRSLSVFVLAVLIGLMVQATRTGELLLVRHIPGIFLECDI